MTTPTAQPQDAKVSSGPKKLRTEVLNYMLITFGLMCYSFALVTLILPAHIVGGGATGIATLIFYATGGWLPIGIGYFVVNAVLLAFGIWILGPRFGAKTFYAIGANTVILLVMQKYIPSDLMGLADDTLLSALLGGGMAGVGVALCFMAGGSSGGTDIVAMIINKYRNVSLGKLIMIMDAIIVSCSFFIFHDIPTLVYSFVVMASLGYVLDMVLSGSKSSAQIMIFSHKYQEIADRILTDMKRGATILDATGAYSQQPRKVLLVICRRTETTDIYRVIKHTDPEAFITVGNVMGVFGQGFDALKTK